MCSKAPLGVSHKETVLSNEGRHFLQASSASNSLPFCMVSFNADSALRNDIPFTVCSVKRDGIVLGGRIPKDKMASFKYEVVVDGGSGTCRTCGVLASDMVG